MALSYSIAVGQTLEQLTSGTAAPTNGAGTIELRIDQTTTAITDAGATRALKKGEVQALLRIIEQQLIRETGLVTD